MTEQRQIRNALLATGTFLVLIWSVHFLIEFGGFSSWRSFGNHPRDLSHIWGILTMPFLHAKGIGIVDSETGSRLSHILNNSLSFCVLNTILFYIYHKVALRVWGVLFLFSGAFVWLFANGGNHIGASGVVYGLAFFIFWAGVIRLRNRDLLRISLVVAFLYGSIVWGIFPIQEGVSWEGHMGGAIAGLGCAFLFRNELPERKKYRWEIEEELEKLQSENSSKKKPNGKTPIVQIYRQFRYRGMDRGF